MVCRHCGAALPDDARFCHECGRSTAPSEDAPRAVRSVSWILIGLGALALFGAGALLVLLIAGELPEGTDALPLVAILLANLVLGLGQIGSGIGLRRRSGLAFRVALVVTVLQTLLALVDIGVYLFSDGAGSPALPGVRLALNAVALRQLFEVRDWFRAAAGDAPVGRPSI